jgi:beta-galactosidase GanA
VADPDLKSALGALREMVEVRKGPASEAGPGSWIPKLVIAAVGLIAVAIFAYRQWRQGKQLAGLLHEKTVREVNQANAAVSLANAADTETIKKAEAVNEASVQRLEETQKKLRALGEQKARDEEAIRSIRSWSDITGG